MMIREVVDSCADFSIRLNAVVEQNTRLHNLVTQLESELEKLSFLGEGVTENGVKDSELKRRKKQTVASKSLTLSKNSKSN